MQVTENLFIFSRKTIARQRLKVFFAIATFVTKHKNVMKPFY